MALLDGLKNLFFGAPSSTLPPSAVEAILDLSQRQQPPRMTDRARLAAYHSIPALHVSGRRVAESTAAIKWEVQSENKPVDSLFTDRFLKNPNPEWSGYQYRKFQRLQLDLIGESFALVFGDSPETYEFLPVPAVDVTRRVMDNQEVWFEVHMPHSGRLYVVPPERMLWNKDHDLLSPFERGKGMAHVLSDELEIIEFASIHVRSEFYNNAKPDLLIMLPGADKSIVKAFKKDWMKRYAGPKNRGKPAVFGEGAEDLIVKEMTRSFEELQINESRAMSDDIVYRAWGIPPEILGKVENSNRATIEAAETHFGRYTIKPRLKADKSFWEASVLPLFHPEGGVELTHEDPVPENVAQKLEAMMANKESVTVNEWRAIQGLPPREDGDVYLRNPAQVQEIPAMAIRQEPSEMAPQENRSRAVESTSKRLLLTYDDALDDEFFGFVSDKDEDSPTNGKALERSTHERSTHMDATLAIEHLLTTGDS